MAMRYDPYRQFTGFEGLPSTGMGQGVDTLTQMAVQMFGGSMMNEYGMLPLGLSQANLYDRVERMRMQQAHDAMVAQAFQRDVPGLVHTARGMATLAGTPWNEQTINQAYAFADAITSMGPAGIQMFGPQLIDAMAGHRGSSGVMAEMMFQGSQLRLDPVTGQAGMSPESATALQQKVFDEMFSGGAYLRNTGLGAGMSGALFSEMARYGMLPPPTRLQELNEGLIAPAIFDRIETLSSRGNLNEAESRELSRLRRSMGDNGLDLSQLSADDISNIRQTPGVADALVNFDAGKVSDTLEKYGSVVQAMREIFGDAGRPNAPIPELINAINALSGGAMPQLQPHELEGMVRTTYNLARSAGIGMEGLMVLTQAAEVQAAQYGLPPVMANELVQQSLAFRAAYMHQGMGSYAAWGRGNIDEITMQSQEMAAGGQDSPMANRIGMAMRLNAAIRESGGELTPGSRAAAYVSAVEAGLTEFVDPTTGETQSIIMGEDAFLDMMSEGTGVNRAQLYEMLEDRFNNMREFRRQGGTGTIRRAQNVELRSLLRDQLTESTMAGLSADGIAQDDARALAIEATGVAMEAYQDPNVYANDQRRSAVIGQRIRARYEAIAAGGGPQAQAARDLLNRQGDNPAFWAAMAEQQYSEVQEIAEDNPFVQTTAQNLLTLIDPEMAQQASREEARERATALYQRSLAPLQRGGMLRRFVTAMQQADEDTDLTEVFLESVGGERQDVMQRVLTGTAADERQTRGIFQGVQEAQAAFQEAQQRYQESLSSDDPNVRQEAWKELQARGEGFREANQRLSEYLGRQGFFVGESISQQEVVDMQRRRKWVSEQLENRTATDEQFQRGVAIERQQADDLQAQVMSDEQLMVRLGAPGREKLSEMQDVTRRLDEMAVRYAGGSLSDLLQGNLAEGISDRERRRIMNQAAAYRERQGELYEWFSPRVEGVMGFSFLSEEKAEKLQDLTARFAEDTRLREAAVFAGTPEDVMQMGDQEFARLQASAAWGELSEADRDLISESRAAYLEEQERVRTFRREQDPQANAEKILEQSLERLTGEDLTMEQVREMVGGDQAFEALTGDATIEGRRRRAGFAMMTRDIARMRELESKKESGSLSKAESSELARLQKETADYDDYWKDMGTEMGPDAAMAPGADTFQEAYEKIPSVGPPQPKEGEEKEMEFTMNVQNLYIDGEPQGEAEGTGAGSIAGTGLGGSTRGMA